MARSCCWQKRSIESLPQSNCSTSSLHSSILFLARRVRIVLLVIIGAQTLGNVTAFLNAVVNRAPTPKNASYLLLEIYSILFNAQVNLKITSVFNIKGVLIMSRLWVLFLFLFISTNGYAEELNGVASTPQTQSQSSKDYRFYRRELIRESLADQRVLDRLRKVSSVDEANDVLGNSIQSKLSQYKSSHGLKDRQVRSGGTLLIQDRNENLRDALFELGPEEFERLFPRDIFVTDLGTCTPFQDVRLSSVIMKYTYRNVINYIIMDRLGRPTSSFVHYTDKLWPNTAPTQRRCQSSIGNWGEDEQWWNNISYDGGHLVPRRLNGYGGRANVVPQQADLNQGLWNNEIEATAAYCISATRLRQGKSQYWVDVQYYSSSHIIPGNFEAFLNWTNSDGVMEEAAFYIDNTNPSDDGPVAISHNAWFQAGIFKSGVTALCVIAP